MTAINLDRVHLVGIGGAGMSGIARILLAQQKVVSGSDAKDSRAILALRAAGAVISVGHAAENLTLAGELPTVVVTSLAAIPKDNPELVAARANDIPVITRSELLALLMRDSKEVLIAGTHGKTSTTSMAVVAMQSAGMDPSFAIGGQLNKAGTNAHHGTGACFVAEADESDASLLQYHPHIAVITNIEPDHLDFFGTAEKYFAVFEDFARNVDPEGALVVCLDDPHAADLGLRLHKAQRDGAADALQCRIVGYGSADAASRYPELAHTVVEGMEVTGFGSQVQMRVGETNVEVALHIPGMHMVLNAAAAISAGVLAGGDVHRLAHGVSEFTGVRRRFEFHGRVQDGPFAGVEVYDDYAHHPTEVSAVLTAAQEKQRAQERGTQERGTQGERGAQGRGRVVVAFQPHLYSRTIEFHKEFAQALSLADAVVLLDIFGAREQPVEGVDSRIIAKHVTVPVIVEPNFSAVVEAVASCTQANDIVLTMGAGSVTMLAPEILHYLQEAQ